MKQITWFVLSCLVLLATAQAASFDCAKAGTKSEKLICGNAELSKLDENLNNAYLQSLEQSNVKQQAVKNQREWLKDVRNACQVVDCLKDAYEARIKKLALISSSAHTAPKVTQSCDNQIRGILFAATELAANLPTTKPHETEHAENFDDLRTGYSRLVPDIAVALATAQCKLEASKTISLIASPKLKREAEWHVAVEYASQGDLDAAARLIDQFSNQDSFYSEARYALALAYMQHRNISKAKELVEAIDLYRAPDLLVRVYELIDYAASHPEVASAVSAVADPKVFWKTESNDQRVLLVDMLKERGQQEAASQLLKDIVATYSNAGNSFGLIKAYIHIGELKKASISVSRVELPNDRVRLYVQIANASKDKEFSKETLQLARSIAMRCQSKTSDCWMAWLDLARGYAGIGDIDTAIQLTKLPGTDSEFMLSEIAIARAIKLDLAGARRVIDMMSSHDITGGSPHYQSALEALAIGEARKGDYRESQLTWQNIPNTFIQSTIVAAAAAESPPKDVIISWLEMTKSIADDEMQARSVQPLMAAFVRVGGIHDAQEWLQKNTSALTPLGVARAKLGIAQGALGIVPGRVWLAKLHL